MLFQHNVGMPNVSLMELARVFFTLGATGFGGPVALIALMEKEVTTRGWVSAKDFERAYVICKLLPGPVAYQVALWLGQHLRGRVGGLISGVFFLLPAIFLMLLLSYFYSEVKRVPSFSSVMEGMRVAAIVVILDSVWRMLRPYRNDVVSWAFIAVSMVLMLVFPRWEPMIIVLGGLAMIIAKRAGMSVAGVAFVPLFQLFWAHFKAGAFVFGTGLAIIPVLEAEAVRNFGWLTREEFLDGIAFGQITPGPITITSVFVGFLAQGFSGAFAALLGMYLPGLLIILFLLPLFARKIEGKPWLKDFQAGAVPMVIGCIMGATWYLSQSSIPGYAAGALLLVLWGMALFTRTPAWLLLPIGGAISFIGAKL